MRCPESSARLWYRKILESDAQSMFDMDSRKEVAKYVGNEPLKNIEESIAIIKNIRAQYQENDIGRVAVIEKNTNRFIGWSGLKYYRSEINGHQNFYELGYRFLPKFWGKGYAKESVQASLKFGFEILNLEKIFAYTHLQNKASQHILLGNGFILKNDFIDLGDHCLWFECENPIKP